MGVLFRKDSFSWQYSSDEVLSILSAVEPEAERPAKKFPDLVALQYDVAASESRLVIANPWLKGMSYKVRAQGVREFESARLTNIANVKTLNAERRAAADNRRLARFRNTLQKRPHGPVHHLCEGGLRSNQARRIP